MRVRLALCAVMLLAGSPGTAAGEGELVVRPGEPVAAVVAGAPARLVVGSARVDRLTLDPDFVAAHGLRPAALLGRADLEVAGRREFKGHNRPLAFSIAGQPHKGRAFWFDGAPDSGVDGSIGPWALPQRAVTFVLGADDAAMVATTAPMHGNINSSSYFVMRGGADVLGVSFDVEDGERYPVASAAAGALLARQNGGELSGASWDVEVLLGVKRPVRLLTLREPLAIGPLRFTRIAVRVRDRYDTSGRGGAIPDADAGTDPEEIVIEASDKVKPVYSLSIPLAGMATCSRLRFDRVARTIEWRCRPAAAG